MSEKEVKTMTADERQAMQDEKDKLLLEKERLELSKLRADVAEINRKQETARQTHQANESALAFERERIKNLQTNCNHMKGGPGQLLLHGGAGYGEASGNYAIIRHTFNSGVTFVLCLRCGKEWWPQDAEYGVAMRWPTRNSPSSGSLMLGLMNRGLIKTKSD